MGSTIEDKEGEMSLLKECDQKSPILMRDLFKHITKLEKIGEGIFGEVYLGYAPHEELRVNESQGKGDCPQPDVPRSKVVFKVLPIQGIKKVNGERQKRFEEVESEVIITNKLADLTAQFSVPGFVIMNSCFLAYGEYSPNLVDAWEIWDKENDSDNDVPNHFPQDQKYLVLVLEHVGEDAGHFKYKNVKQMFFTVIQVLHSLAGAEAALEFEHRDLHGNNILIQATHLESTAYRIRRETRKVPTFGVSPTMIDFTFSRIKGDKKESPPIFLDMQDDDEMFMSAGDYQFDIYRMMRDENRNEWTSFHPKTNLFWMDYFIFKLLCIIHKKKMNVTTNQENYFFKRQLQLLRSRLWSFKSSLEFVDSPYCSKLLQTTTSSGPWTSSLLNVTLRQQARALEKARWGTPTKK